MPGAGDVGPPAHTPPPVATLSPTMTREIALTQGKVALVDDADYELVSRYRWNVTDSGYAHTILYERGKYAGYLRMHRLILGLGPREIADHINGDRLDNRRCNLRRCNYSQNSMNRRKMRGATSQYKGVIWNPEQKTWDANIYPNNTHKRLGHYHDEEAAARAYDAAATQLYGDFAKVNFAQGRE